MYVYIYIYIYRHMCQTNGVGERLHFWAAVLFLLVTLGLRQAPRSGVLPPLLLLLLIIL